MTHDETRTTRARYTNKVTGEAYTLAFDVGRDDTALSRAWDLVNLAASLKGWNKYDVGVKVISPCESQAQKP